MGVYWTLPVWPEAVLIYGKRFDPAAHFRDWRQRQEEWTNGKAGRLAQARARAEALRLGGATNAAIAAALNAETPPARAGRLKWCASCWAEGAGQPQYFCSSAIVFALAQAEDSFGFGGG